MPHARLPEPPGNWEFVGASDSEVCAGRPPDLGLADAVDTGYQRLEPLFSKDRKVMTDLAFICEIRAWETPTTWEISARLSPS